jgi:Mg-chelatase subunit ChlD
MSWLSEAWKQLKRGRSDVETALSFMKPLQKEALSQRLYPVLFAVDTAANYSNDPRIEQAKAVVNDLLRALES